MSILISRTPFRISFFGGGTDYPVWYRKHGGAVLSTTIDKYCYLTCRYLPPFFPDTYRIVWSHIENVSSISEILHPVVREGLRMIGFDGKRGVEIHHQGDLPARAGMGSSSSFANGLVLALSTLRGDKLSQEDIYLKAIELEQDVLKEKVGSQDQVATACGGLNIIRFDPSGAIHIDPLDIPQERRTALNDHLMLFYTGTNRIASEVAARVIANLENRTGTLKKMRNMVDTAAGILRGDGSVDDFGALLHETWQEKKSLSAVISNPVIDEIYEKALSNGAIGGKLLGAGTSGFMLFYVPLNRQEAVLKALSSLIYVPFKFENEGCIMLSN